MDFKKVKLFSYGVLLSVFLLVIGILGVKYIGDYYINTINTNLVSDAYQKIAILRWVIVILFSVTLFISYISLLIQTCRIDESSESHFYIIMAMLSVIPLCALTLIVRTSHLQILERNKKIALLASSLENNTSEDKSNLSEENAQGNISKSIEELEENKDTLLDVNQNLIEDIKEVENTNIDHENDEWEKQDFLFDDFKPKLEDDISDFDFMKNNDFNREKYLSLKGTNYSKEKQYGKKKISGDKWKELEELVSQLEEFKIDEETFYTKKDELLTK